MPEGYSLREFNSWKTGGSCALLIAPHTVDEAVDFLKCCKNEKRNVYVLGGGTNVLVADGFINAAVLYTGHIKGIKTVRRENFVEIEADCGCTTKQLLAFALENSLTGLEFLTGIPGTLGGALKGNAGGRSDDGFNRIITEITTIDKNFNARKYAGNEINWQYRQSPVDTEDLLIASCKMALLKAEKKQITDKIRSFADLKKGQPIGRATAGCVFKNPAGGSAGKMIDECGCRGMKIGDAAVSSSHANFIENTGSASADEIYKLCELCRSKVLEKFGVKLEYEIRFIGDFKKN